MQQSVRRILHPTDFSTCAMKALGLATELGKHLNARVDVMHVTNSDDIDESFPYLDFANGAINADLAKRLRETLDELYQEKERQLKERLANLYPEGGEALLSWGRPYPELQKQLKDYDLVVMGAHGANPIDNIMLGGLAGRLVRRSPVPVLTVREECQTEAIKRVLVATDFSDAATQAWSWTEQLLDTGVKRLAVHLIDDVRLAAEAPYVEATSEALELFAEGDCEQPILRQGDPVRDLPKLASEVNADLIVIGLQPHSVLAGWLLGGHADALLRSSPVPILSIPLVKDVKKTMRSISEELASPLP